MSRKYISKFKILQNCLKLNHADNITIKNHTNKNNTGYRQRSEQIQFQKLNQTHNTAQRLSNKHLRQTQRRCVLNGAHNGIAQLKSILQIERFRSNLAVFWVSANITQTEHATTKINLLKPEQRLPNQANLYVT